MPSFVFCHVVNYSILDTGICMVAEVASKWNLVKGEAICMARMAGKVRTI